MHDNNIYTLDSAVDEYLIQRGITNRKYYPSFLLQSKYVWKELFKNTIYATQSEWKTLKKGEPYNYVDVPRGMVRLFTVSLVDPCGNIVPLFYNNELNIISKPKQKNCGCGVCDCAGGLCEEVGSLTRLSKVLFTINGVDYNEITYLKVCPNGDIIEYREVPTKKYNDFTGDGGDYNSDFNNDYLIGNPAFSNFTIVTEKFQKILCHIETEPCGCPANTTANEELFLTHCGAYLPCFNRRRKKHCDMVLGNINNNCLGEVKISECGTRIYYKPHRKHNDANGINEKLPEFLLVNYQTSGENCGSAVSVPDYAIEAMFYGIDYYSKRFNTSFSVGERQAAKYAFVDAQNKLIMYLNPLNLDNLAQVADAPIRF